MNEENILNFFDTNLKVALSGKFEDAKDCKIGL